MNTTASALNAKAVPAAPRGGRRADDVARPVQSSRWGERTLKRRRAANGVIRVNPIDEIRLSPETERMENAPATTAYDEVPYPSAVYSQTHPDRLAVIATLSGMKPAPVEHCRVLELGCGDGFNLIAMAYGLPGSEFVGIDLAAQPIARGVAIVERLGLANISLQARDVAEAGPELGEFDYIIAHGLYAWVPQHVRERIMEICSRNLSARGVAYVSYNAYPGNHLRDLVRGMMRYHAAHFSRPADQIGQARGLVKLLSEAGEKTDPYLQILARELERIKKYTDAGFFHDDLSSINQPVYFHEFMAHAAREGLQYLGEADLSEKQVAEYPAHVQAVLRELDPNDIVGGEQYRDFLRCRAFRQTLLCRQGIPLIREFSPAHMGGLFISGEIRSASVHPDTRSESPESFIGRKNAELETDRPLVKAALRRLGAAWPASIHFPDLLAQVRDDLARNGDEQAVADADDLAAALLRASIAGALELRAHNPRFVTELGAKPEASALARIQIQTGDRVSTLLHEIVRVGDDISRLLLSLLDGTRDRRALLADLTRAIEGGQIKAALTPAPQLSEESLEEVLGRLARTAVLVA